MDEPAPPISPDHPAGVPLLPPFFHSPATFLWLWILPVGLLLALNLQGYLLVEGNMTADERANALLLGAAGLANLLLGAGLFFVARLDGTTVRRIIVDVAAVLTQVAYLWLAASLVDKLLPATVTVWIYPTDRYLFNQFSFAMLPLFFGIFRLACGGRTAPTGTSVVLSLVCAVLAPAILYIFFEVFHHIAGFGESSAYVICAVVVLFGLVMFVALVRVLLLGLRGFQRCGAAGERAAIVLFALVLPICGLLLNIRIPFPVDFQAWEVYALVLVNTAILLLASLYHERSPRLCFNLLCATFPFSLYFFVVFLPYTPLSILAVLALGAGFLVLAPTILFTLQLHLLNRSLRNPLLTGSRASILLAGILCGLLLPAFFTVRGLADKEALNAALDYVYSPAVGPGEMKYTAGLGNLRRALDNHRHYKNGIYYPLLSDYYAWLVFDNLVLPDDKLDRLENIFFGPPRGKSWRDPVRRGAGLWGSDVRHRAHMPRAVPPPRTVEASELNLRSLPGKSGDTEFTLALALRNTGSTGAEYVKTLPLPPGVFVTGFRMKSRGVTVAGRIFEKKTALWVYTMIRDSERRDPGLLFYSKPDELELHVFPVLAGTPVMVEIDFLAAGPVSADDLNGQEKDPAGILAGVGRRLPAVVGRADRGTIAIVSPAEPTLPVVEREPYLHLIVDRSRDNAFAGDLAATLRQLKERFPNARQVRITTANFDVSDVVPELTAIDLLLSADPARLRPTMPVTGGFNLDLALAHAIRLHRDADLDQRTAGGGPPVRPIFVILSAAAERRTMNLETSNAWLDLLPGLEIDEYSPAKVFVTQVGEGTPATPLLRLGNSIRSFRHGHAVRFQPAGAEARLEYWAPATSEWRPVPNVSAEPASSPWTQAVSLSLQQQDHTRSPGNPGSDFLALVKASRETGILLAGTSYIVVENAAQWRVLELSEHQKLEQNAALDFLETPAPPALYVALGFGLWLGMRWIRRTRRVGFTAAA